MADWRGNNLNHAIIVDEETYHSVPRRRVEQRTGQPSNPPPGAVIIALSDSEDDATGPYRQPNTAIDDDEDGIEISDTPLAWAAAQNNRRSEHRMQANQQTQRGPSRSESHPVPIGALAEKSDREQATSSRDNATTETERVVREEDVEVINPSLPHSTGVTPLQSTIGKKFSKPQRAIKGAKLSGPPRSKSKIRQTSPADHDGATNTASRPVLEPQDTTGLNKIIHAPLHNENAERSLLAIGQEEVHSLNTSEKSSIVQTTTRAPLSHNIVTPDSAVTTELQTSDPRLDNETGDMDPHSSTMTTSQTNINDISSVRSAIDGCILQHLQSRFEDHAYLTGAELWRQRLCFEREARSLLRNRQRPRHPTLPAKYTQSISPFADMASIQIPFEKHSHQDKHLHRDDSVSFSQEMFHHGSKPKSAVSRSSWRIPVTSFKSNVIAVPPFKEYVSLNESILADNESKMHLVPYIHDVEDSPRDLRTELPLQYEVTQDSNVLASLRRDQCRFYKDGVNNVLEHLGISWNDVLYWFLASEKDIKYINNKSEGSSQFERCLVERSQYDREISSNEENDFYVLIGRDTKDTDKWKPFLSSLPEPTTRGLRLSALICAAFLSQCHFNIWYLAENATSLLDWKKTKLSHPRIPAEFKYRNIMCRVCHVHNCLHHGEIRQAPRDNDDVMNGRIDSNQTESDEDSTSDDASVSRDGTSTSEDDVSIAENVPQPHNSQLPMNDHMEETNNRPGHEGSDSDTERVINYRVFTNATASESTEFGDVTRRKPTSPPDGRFSTHYWRGTNTWKLDKRKPFIPCSHEGSCDQAKCRCYRENINCEKTCKCLRSCKRRFPGCTCASKAKPCSSEKHCLCREFNRECDADLCFSCGAVEVLDPVNRYNEKVQQCANVQVQRGVPRKTLMGSSKVHGFGLYAGEDFQCGDLIGEYVGETTSPEESDRRATIYNHQKTLYQFRLNGPQEVDGTSMGNKLRYINNADEKYTNCRPMLLLCNTVIRIALYARKPITAGTELFFNYGYQKEIEEKQGFRNPGGKGKEVVAVKKAAKQSAKHNTKQKSRHTSSHESPRPSSPAASRVNEKTTNVKVLAATAKAREAKRIKYEARLAAGISQATTGDGNVVRQTRTRSVESRTSRQVSTIASNEGTAADTPEGPQGRGRPRHASPSTTVYAVKNRTERRIQSNVGAKRKRPVVTNSDDE